MTATIEVYRMSRDRWDRAAIRLSKRGRVARWRGYLLASVVALLAAAAAASEQHILSWTLISLEPLILVGWFLLCRKLDRRLTYLRMQLPYNAPVIRSLGESTRIWSELPQQMQQQTRWLLEKTYDAAGLAEGAEVAVGRRLGLFRRFEEQVRRETTLRQTEALGDDDVAAAEATLDALDEFWAGRAPEVVEPTPQEAAQTRLAAGGVVPHVRLVDQMRRRLR